MHQLLTTNRSNRQSQGENGLAIQRGYAINNPVPSVTASYQHARLVKRLVEKMNAPLPMISLLEAKNEGISLQPEHYTSGSHINLLCHSYVAALELRIEKLERRLDYAKSRKESVGNYESETVSPEAVDRRDSLAYIRDAIHRKAAKNRENSDLNSLVSDFGFMYVHQTTPILILTLITLRSVNATTRDFELAATNMTFARLVLAATVRDPIPPSVELNLPPRQVTNSIIQYFMANIHILFPCFPETALLTVADDIYHSDQRIIKDSDYWLFYMVLAIASTAQSKAIHDSYYDSGVEYLAKALKFGDRALAPGTIAQIQSLLLLTIYSTLDPAHFDSWHLIGFTARAVVDLGLHQDPPSSSVPDRTALDMRRRVFYSVYALDR